MNSEIENSNKRLIYGFLILFSYMLSRALIYSRFSDENGFSYLYRDTLMNIPRLACLCLCFFAFSLKNLKPNFDKFLFVAVPFLLLSLLVFLRSFYIETYTLSTEELLVFVFSSFVVGFFEETLFRGLFFDNLSKIFGNSKAIWLSSFLFMIFHIQAQSIPNFPFLFVAGLIDARLRMFGASIFLLAFCHGVYDSLWGVWASVSATPSYITVGQFVLTCAIFLLVYNEFEIRRFYGKLGKKMSSMRRAS